MPLLKWRKRSPYRISEVIVPATAVGDSAYPSDLSMYVSMFVRHALDSALYTREELPHEALLAAHLDKYVGEVNNGGHAQFVGNTGWNPDVRADVREALATLGVDEAVSIFADFEAFSVAEPERFEHCSGEAYEQDPFFHELDTRFYGPVEESIVAAHREWLKTRPWLRVVPDADYRQGPGWKTPDHPLKETRLEARRRKNAPELTRALLRLRDSLHRDDPKDES